MSNILAVIFRFCFVLGLVAALLQISAQLLKKPLEFRTGANSYISLGKPGLQVTARRENNRENLAPDTTVDYSFRDSNNMSVSGSLKLGKTPICDGSKRLQELIAQKGVAGKFEQDTTISIIGQQYLFNTS